MTKIVATPTSALQQSNFIAQFGPHFGVKRTERLVEQAILVARKLEHEQAPHAAVDRQKADADIDLPIRSKRTRSIAAAKSLLRCPLASSPTNLESETDICQQHSCVERGCSSETPFPCFAYAREDPRYLNHSALTRRHLPCSKPAAILRAVVFPQPLGPKQCHQLARGHVKRERIERDDICQTIFVIAENLRTGSLSFMCFSAHNPTAGTI